MNINIVHGLIKETLSASGLRDNPIKFDTLLVGITFMGETHFYEDGRKPSRLGMMAVDTEEAEWFIRSYMMGDRVMAEAVNNVCLIDLRNDNMKDILLALEYNIAFQILYVYFWYMHKNGKQRMEGIDDVITMYGMYWGEQKPVETVERLIRGYASAVGLASEKD